MGWTTGGSIPGKGKNFSLCHRSQTDSGAHPVSNPMGSGKFSLGVNRPGRESDYSLPSSTEVKNALIS
jgi:hypothetical protein